MKLYFFLATFLWGICGLTPAQATAVQVHPATLSIPFGAVPGKLVAISDYLVFVDDEKPEASFAIPRGEIKALKADGGILTVETAKPVLDRSGERSRLSFRLEPPDGATWLVSWSRQEAVAPGGARASGEPATPDRDTYRARHRHFPFGNCDGRLVISQDSVVFESVTELDDSRQWDLKDLKEIKRSNPYEIKIIPFAGKEFNLLLVGKGMDSADFQALVDRITGARLAR